MNKNVKKWLDKNFNSDISNKTIVITGANSGIGYEVAYLCAFYKANVIMAIRNLNKGQIAINNILKDIPDANISMMQLDVSSFSSIINFVNTIKENNIDIDVFYHNAGVLKATGNSIDNIPMIMATNHIGPYLLNNLLLDYFKSLNHEVMVIFTTSIAQYLAKINYNDFLNERKFKVFKTYCNSKLSITHYYLDLIDKLKESNIKLALVHPGITHTPLIKKSFNKLISFLADKFMNIFFHKPDKAALSTMYLLNDNIDNNLFVGPRGLFMISGYPKVYKLSKKIKKNQDLTIKCSEEIIDKVLNNCKTK